MGHCLFQDGNSFPIGKLKENFKEHIMSKDKYTSVFFHEIEATVFIIVFINILGYPPVLAGKLSVMWCI